jgi:hypothetical protein
MVAEINHDHHEHLADVIWMPPYQRRYGGVDDHNREPWWPDEVAMALRRDLKVADIARHLGRTEAAIANLRRRMKAEAGDAE